MESEHNPWHVRDSRTVYDNAWIRVREDAVTRPDGEPGIYGVVEFKNTAVGIVPLTDDGKTILVGQHRYPLGQYSWEIVEGGGPPDQTPLEAAKRELREETGIEAGRWTYLGELHLSNSVTDEVGCVFLAEDLRFGPAAPEGTERLALKRVPLEEAYRMAMTGEISDGLAVVGLARAHAYLDSGRTLKPLRRSLPDPGC